jgi:thymidylate kinase
MDSLITIEGADLTGKSTTHRGFTNKAGEHVPGLVGRLQNVLDTEVHPSREPGCYNTNTGRWWAEKPSLNLEPHLQTFERYVGMAALHTTISNNPMMAFVRDVMTVACFVNRHGSLPAPLYRTLLDNSPVPETLREEMEDIHQSFQDKINLLEVEPTVAQRFRKTNARSLLRLALMKPRGLNPTAVGLIFFAGHLLHSEWAKSRSGVIVSDRAGESQKAYAQARGDDSRVLELYRHFEPLKPDLLVLLTCSYEQMKQRLEEGSSQEEEWSSLDLATAVQSKYKEMLQFSDAPDHIRVDTSDMTPENVIETVTQRVLQHLSHNDITSSSNKTSFP